MKMLLRIVIENPFLTNIFFLFILILGHISLLINTTFIDWPEIILFPWLMKQGLLLYKDIIVVHSPGSVYLPYWFFNLTGYSEFWYRVIAYIFVITNDILIYLMAN